MKKNTFTLIVNVLIILAFLIPCATTVPGMLSAPSDVTVRLGGAYLVVAMFIATLTCAGIFNTKIERLFDHLKESKTQ